MKRKKNPPSTSQDSHQTIAETGEHLLTIKLWDAIIHFCDPSLSPQKGDSHSAGSYPFPEVVGDGPQNAIRTCSLGDLKNALPLAATAETYNSQSQRAGSKPRGGLKIKKTESTTPSNVKPFVPRKPRPSDETP
jgi:hypothetical protein